MADINICWLTTWFIWYKNNWTLLLKVQMTKVSIASNNDLVQTKLEAITWTADGLIHCRIHVSLSLYELTHWGQIGLDCICLTTTHVLQDILAVLHR